MKALLSIARRHWLAGGLLIALGAPASAKFMQPEPAPVDRLLKNAEAYVVKHPDEALARYTLARIHYLAFHLKRDSLPAFVNREAPDALPNLAPQWMVRWSEDKKAQALSERTIADHALKGVLGFREALRLDPKNGLFQLGLASLEEEFAAWNHAEPKTLPAELTGITVAKIREDYARVLELSLAGDSKRTEMPVAGLDSITSYEAATALARLSKEQGAELSESEKKEVARAGKVIEQFKGLKLGPITPVVFSFHEAAHLDALLAPETTVDFDLRGYGLQGERWPWVKPELGLLVWDPERTGEIHSARQLFGSYMFEIFRKVGYAALAALDDNADGVLSGAELDGISVWFDRNGDGVSSPGEVVPVRDLGVVSVATTMDGRDGIHPTNSRGIILRDGKTLRSWDWIVEPVRTTGGPIASAGAP